MVCAKAVDAAARTANKAAIMKYFALLMSDPFLFQSHFAGSFNFSYWRSGALQARRRHSMAGGK
jgi:hypothetical protein